MAKIPLLYKKVYMFAAVLFLVGLAVFLYGLYRSRAYYDMEGFGIATLGAFGGLAGLVTAYVYVGMERRFRKALGEPLLAFTAGPEAHSLAVEKTISQIKAANTVTWLTMLVVCLLVALIGPLLLEDGLAIFLIGLGLAAVLSGLAFLVTAYRIRKLRKGRRQVVLARHGVLVAGEFHAWDHWGSQLLSLTLMTPEQTGRDHGLLSGSYRAIGAYRSQEGFFNLAVPPEQISQAEAAVEKILSGQKDRPAGRHRQESE